MEKLDIEKLNTAEQNSLKVLRQQLSQSARGADAQQVIGQILAWTSSQPTLTSRLCQAVAETMEQLQPGLEVAFVNELVQTVFTPQLLQSQLPQDRPVVNLLQDVQDVLVAGPGRQRRNLRYYQKALAAATGLEPDFSATEKELLQAQIVTLDRQSNKIKIANSIYKKIFNPTWVNQELQQFRFDQSHLILATSLFSLLVFLLLQNFSRELPFSPLAACRREAALSEAMNASSDLDELRMQKAIADLEALQAQQQLSTPCQNVLAELQYSYAIYIQASLYNNPLAASQMLCKIPASYFSGRELRPWFTRWSNLYRNSSFPKELAAYIAQNSCPGAPMLSRHANSESQP